MLTKLITLFHHFNSLIGLESVNDEESLSTSSIAFWYGYWIVISLVASYVIISSVKFL